MTISRDGGICLRWLLLFIWARGNQHLRQARLLVQLSLYHLAQSLKTDRCRGSHRVLPASRYIGPRLFGGLPRDPQPTTQTQNSKHLPFPEGCPAVYHSTVSVCSPPPRAEKKRQTKILLFHLLRKGKSKEHQKLRRTRLRCLIHGRGEASLLSDPLKADW